MNQFLGKPLDPPAPWFGGKRKVATEVWKRFGKLTAYCSPFVGLGAVELACPPDQIPAYETINDLNGYIVNFYRAVQRFPRHVAYYANNPTSHADLVARHRWLVGTNWPQPHLDIPQDYETESLRSAYIAGYYHTYKSPYDNFRFRIYNDPDFCDPKIAGWWVWGQSSWIGGGWCFLPYKENRGDLDGVLQVSPEKPDIPGHVPGVKNQRPQLGHHNGIHTHRKNKTITDYIEALSERFRMTRILAGDWVQAIKNSPTIDTAPNGMIGVFLDPPYGVSDRDNRLYAAESLTVAQDCLDWAKQHDTDRRFRIALCGYDGEHNELEERGWSVYAWDANGGMERRGGKGKGTLNATRERIWFSPYCINESPIQASLWS